MLGLWATCSDHDGEVVAKARWEMPLIDVRQWIHESTAVALFLLPVPSGVRLSKFEHLTGSIIL